jgi:cardiolipin synthase
VSKLNTGAQIVLACLVLAALAFHWNVDVLLALAMAVVAVLTLLSVGFYLAEWLRHMNGSASGH